MKKIILLFISLFILSGCSATYDLEIYNEKYKENVTINSLTDDATGMKDWNIPVNADEESIDLLLTISKVTGITYYDNDSVFEDNYYKYNYSHEFGMTDYYKSYFAVNSYDFFAVYYDDTDESGKKDLVTISTSLKNLLFEKYTDLESITVNIKTNHKVYSSNADSKDGYTYTWNITKDNYEKKPVQIRIYKDKYVLNYNNELNRSLYIFLIVLGVLLLGALLLYIRARKIDKI